LIVSRVRRDGRLTIQIVRPSESTADGFEIKRHGQHLTFKFNKRGEYLVGMDNEALSVAPGARQQSRSFAYEHQ
jgi:hypothetical protein